MIRPEWYSKLLDRISSSVDEADGDDELTVILTLLTALNETVNVEEKDGDRSRKIESNFITK